MLILIERTRIHLFCFTSNSPVKRGSPLIEQLEGEHCSIPHSRKAFKTDLVTVLWELRPSLQPPPNTKQTKLKGQTLKSQSPRYPANQPILLSLWFNDSASSTVQMATALKSVCSGNGTMATYHNLGQRFPLCTLQSDTICWTHQRAPLLHDTVRMDTGACSRYFDD